jgi:hypothetical protein
MAMPSVSPSHVQKPETYSSANASITTTANRYDGPLGERCTIRHPRKYRIGSDSATEPARGALEPRGAFRRG